MFNALNLARWPTVVRTSPVAIAARFETSRRLGPHSCSRGFPSGRHEPDSLVLSRGGWPHFKLRAGSRYPRVSDNTSWKSAHHSTLPVQPHEGDPGVHARVSTRIRREGEAGGNACMNGFFSTREAFVHAWERGFREGRDATALQRVAAAMKRTLRLPVLDRPERNPRMAPGPPNA